MANYTWLSLARLSIARLRRVATTVFSISKNTGRRLLDCQSVSARCAGSKVKARSSISMALCALAMSLPAASVAQTNAFTIVDKPLNAERGASPRSGPAQLEIAIDINALRQAAINVGTRVSIPLGVDDKRIFTIGEVGTTSSGSLQITGSLVDEPGGQVFLVVTPNGIAQGLIVTTTATHTLRYESTGRYSMSQADTAQNWSELPPLVPEPTRSSKRAGSQRLNAEQTAADDGSVIDVMVLYTNRTRLEAGGDTAMQASADLAILAANTGYQNSGVKHSVRLVHSEAVDYWETNSIAASLSDLTFYTPAFDGPMDDIHQLRNDKGADVVILVTKDRDFCGRAWVMTTLDPNFEDRSFAVVSNDCLLDGRTLAHEVGHVMGLAHNREADNLTGIYEDSYGYTDPAGQWRTIMAYNTCRNGPCVALNYYSNPLNNFEGTAMGVLAPSPVAADSVRSLNKAARTVAGFRASALITEPTFVLPQTGESLAARNQRFIWQGGGQTVDAWQLWLGSAPGESDIYNSGSVPGTDVVASGLPTRGETIHATLRYLIGATWRSISTTYRASNGGQPLMISPAPGSVLPGNTAVFNWVSGGASVNHWRLTVLDPQNPQGGEFFTQRIDGSVTEMAAAGWPTDGRAVVVELSYSLDGVTTTTLPYSYATPDSSLTEPSVTSPANDTAITPTQTFTIDTGDNDLARWRFVINVGSPFADEPVADSGWTNNRSITLSGWPSDGSTVYGVLNCRYSTGAACRQTIYQYSTRGPTSTNSPSISSPEPDSDLPSGPVEVFWQDNDANVARWRIRAGADPYASEYFVSDWFDSTVESTNATGWPLDGSVVHLTLEYIVEGATESSGRTFAYRAPVSLPQLTIADASVKERDGTVGVLVERSTDTGDTSVRVSTFDITAKAGSDYTAVDTRITFTTGERRKRVAIEILDDDVTEFNERFEVLLTDAIGGQITRNKAAVDIADDDPTVTPGDDAVELSQVVTPDSFSAVGDIVQLELAVLNKSDQSLSGIVVDNPNTGGRVCVIASLWMDTVARCASSYRITQRDVANGSVTFNTTLAADQLTDTISVSNTITLDNSAPPPAARIAVSTRVEPETFSFVGQPVRLFVSLKNTGDSELTNIKVRDSVFGESICELQSLWLDTNASCEAFYRVTQEDMERGKIEGVMQVSATQLDDTQSLATTVRRETRAQSSDNGQASLQLQVNPTQLNAVGQVLTMAINVTNSGPIPLTSVALTSSLKSAIACDIGELYTGISTLCTVSYAVTQTDLQNGSVTATFELSADQLADPETASITVKTSPESNTSSDNKFVLVARAQPTAFSEADEAIEIVFTVTNTTSETLNDLQVWKQQQGSPLRSVCASSSLAPQTTMECTSIFNTTQDDLDRGFIEWQSMVDTREHTNGAVTTVRVQRSN